MYSSNFSHLSEMLGKQSIGREMFEMFHTLYNFVKIKFVKFCKTQ